MMSIELSSLPSEIIQAIESAPKFEEIIDLTDVVSITGRRRHGKSALLYFLLDLLADHYGLYKHAWGIPDAKQRYFSSEIEHLSDIEEIGFIPQSCIGLDEIHRIFSARTSMRDLNRRISEIMTFTGQRNQILLLATLNNALIDIDTFRITNPILIYKRIGRLQANSERHAIREFTIKAAKEWEQIPHGKKESKSRALECALSYIISDDYEGWIYNDLTDWWSESASEMHNLTINKDIISTNLSQYQGDYQKFLYNQVFKFPVHQQKKKIKELRKEYPLEQYYLDKVLPSLDE